MAWRGSASPWRLVQAKLEARNGQPPTLEALCAAVSELWEQQSAFASSPSADVADALAFLSQHLLQAPEDHRDAQQAKVRICRLAAAALAAAQRDALPAAAALVVCNALRVWADPTPADPVLQQAALTAIAAFIPANLRQVPAPEVTALLALLLSLTHSPHTPTPHTATDSGAVAGSSTGPAGPSHTQSTQFSETELEIQYLALSALAQCFPKAQQTALLSGDNVKHIIASFASTLHTWTGAGASGQRLVVGPQTRVLAAFTRLLGIVIMESKKAWTPHTVSLVEGLRALLTYGNNTQATTESGTPGTSAAAPAAQGSTGSTGRYRPPHLRSQGGTGSSARDASVLSDSEASDSEGAGAHPDRVGAHRVRANCLLCLQSMAKTDSRALHAYWTLLLPVQQPLQPRPLVPHLITVLVHDPVPKVRSLAAATILAMLEGPASKGYLVLADARHSHGPRGFTTLSTSLGQMLVATHTGAMHAVKREANLQVLSQVLRVTCVLLSACPEDRMPPTLYPDTLHTCRTPWLDPSTQTALPDLPTTEQHALLTAYTACIVEVLATKRPLRSVLVALKAVAAGRAAQQPVGSQASTQPAAPTTQQPPQQPAGSEGTILSAQGAQGGCLGAVLACELLETCRHAHIPARIEALAGLRGLVEHYLQVLPDLWQEVVHVAIENLSAPTASPSRASHSGGPESGGGGAAAAGTADKAAQHAVKLIATYLVSIGKQQGVEASPLQRWADTDLPSNPHLPYLAAHTDDAGPLSPTTSITANATGSTTDSTAAARHSAEAGTGVQVHNSDQSGTTGSAHGQGSASREAEPAGAQATGRTDRVSGPLGVSVGRWQEALSLVLLPGAGAAGAHVVRSAALTALCDLPVAVYKELSETETEQVFKAALDTAATDDAAAARSAACRLLGALASFPPALATSPHSPTLLTTLAHTVKDTTQSVRISAAWALATAAETIAAAAAAPAASSGGFCTPAEAAAVVGLGRQHRDVLCGAALCASQDDSDKVRGMGLRALGALLYARGSLCGVSDGGATTPPTVADGWSVQAVACLQSAITTGNVRVQCMACVAVQALFSSPATFASTQAGILCLPLVMMINLLVRDCGNFKVRTQAAACLSSIPNRTLLGPTYMDTLSVLCSALDTLESGAPTTTPTPTPVPAAGAAGDAASAPGGTGAADGKDGLVNFKYQPELLRQLRAALLHVMGMGQPSDVTQHKDAIARRLPVMVRAAECVAQSEGVQQSCGQGDVRDSVLASLPDDLLSPPKEPPSHSSSQGGEHGVRNGMASLSLNGLGGPSSPSGGHAHSAPLVEGVRFLRVVCGSACVPAVPAQLQERIRVLVSCVL